MTYLVLLVILLGIITIAQIIRIFELSRELRGKADYEIVTLKDNKTNAFLMMLFLISFFSFCYWQLMKYKDLLLPESASEHGVLIDRLFNFNVILISVVFVITHIMLFYYVFKYYQKKDSKAYFFSHSNKLELIWTSIPAIVLAFVIIYGLSVWHKVTDAPPADAHVIELYAKQFDWTARYAGKDGQLGAANYKKIDPATNALGLDTLDKKGWDDVIVKGEFHIPVGQSVNFKFRSQDVIHSAYMPHFRAQMNCVPGMTTQFHFKPTITTAEMRKKLNNDKFDYILLCNKICGAAHSNMQINIVVESPEDYKKWLDDQKTFSVVSNLAVPKGESKMLAESESQGTVTLKP